MVSRWQHTVASKWVEKFVGADTWDNSGAVDNIQSPALLRCFSAPTILPRKVPYQEPGEISSIERKIELLKSARDRLHDFEMLYNEIAQQPDLRLVCRRQIVRDLESCFAEYRFSFTKNCLQVYVNKFPVVYDSPLHDKEISTTLGPFIVFVRLNSFEVSQSSFHVFPTEEARRSCRGFWHPHVHMSGGVCWGGIASTVNHWLKQGDLHITIHALTRLLRTYNDHSPYEKMDNWQRICCQDCGGWAVSKCQLCQQYVCLDCMALCWKCHRRHCVVCRVIARGSNYCIRCEPRKKETNDANV